MEELRLFRKFKYENEAKEFASILIDNNIKCKIVNNTAGLNLDFNNYNNTDAELFISKSDFEKANNLLEENAKILLKDINQSHYLYEFSDNELLDIVQKKDEWNELDYHLAIQILKERGKEINLESINKIQDERLNELKKPAHSKKSLIILGYALLIIGPVITPFAIISWIAYAFLISGPIIGFTITNSMSTLPNGEKKYSFNKNDRLHGKVILILGVVLLISVIILPIIGLSLAK